MELIPESAALLTELERDGEQRYAASLSFWAQAAVAVVPDLLAVSFTVLRHDVTFTHLRRVASFNRLRLPGHGPEEVSSPVVRSSVAVVSSEPHGTLRYDERTWRVSAPTVTTAHVRSSLVLPVMSSDASVTGAFTFHGPRRGIFTGQVESLAAAVGAWAQGATVDTDLAFDSLTHAQTALARLRTQAMLDRAVAIVAARHGVTAQAALTRLKLLAGRVDASLEDIAVAVVCDGAT